MFSVMIEDLKNGIEPDHAPLRLRLQAAMVKKLAMMRLPREFHHNDNKINPNTEHMLWAATLLEDNEAIDTLITFLITEAHDQYEAQRGAMDASRTPPELPKVVTASLHVLLAISSGEKLNQFLKYKIKKTSSFKELPLIFR